MIESLFAILLIIASLCGVLSIGAFFADKLPRVINKTRKK